MPIWLLCLRWKHTSGGGSNWNHDSQALHHGGQGRGQLVRFVQAPTDHQPMATVHGATLPQRQERPIKKSLPFGPLALTEPLPVLGGERVVRDGGHITEQASLLGLHT